MREASEGGSQFVGQYNLLELSEHYITLTSQFTQIPYSTMFLAPKQLIKSTWHREIWKHWTELQKVHAGKKQQEESLWSNEHYETFTF